MTKKYIKNKLKLIVEIAIILGFPIAMSSLITKFTLFQSIYMIASTLVVSFIVEEIITCDDGEDEE